IRKCVHECSESLCHSTKNKYCTIILTTWRGKMTKKIIVLPGDGIGAEIIGSAQEVLEKVAEIYGHQFEFEQHDIGGAAYDKYGEALTNATVVAWLVADGSLLGAIGGPRYDTLPTKGRPEQGLLK